ncbi:serine hydrolase [Fischerella sp. PCC 9605]|uniref:serine hydrolase n=1 Tax=Fischerella sp. PCC 9605 TaxID=1173024 RepID=UPI0004B2B1D4|nr:serine hydrolase [Fischerella sp. PCC 9605]
MVISPDLINEPKISGCFDKTALSSLASPMVELNFTSLISGFRGTAGIVIRNLDSGHDAQFNQELLFPAASLIKLAILWEFFYQCAIGVVDPVEEIELQAQDMVIGFGVLRQLNPGLKLRLLDLATLMIVISDNTATNLLIDRLGMDNINNSIQQLGLVNTALQYKMFDPRDVNRDNFTSPADVARILEAFVRQRQLLGQYGDEPLRILEGQQCKNKLHLGLPKGVQLANKTGELLWIEHDAGILFAKDKEIVIVVMTQGLSENYDGIRLCRDVAKLVYQNI